MSPSCSVPSLEQTLARWARFRDQAQWRPRRDRRRRRHAWRSAGDSIRSRWCGTRHSVPGLGPLRRGFVLPPGFD